MNENLDKLGVAEPDAKTWLEREPYESWYRDKPLNKIVERLNLMQMTLMYERKFKAREWDQNGLVRRAVKMIELLKTYSHHYRLEGFENDQWLVHNDSGTRWILNLEELTCTCNVWQITGLPCVHVVKVIDHLKYEWVGHYHRVVAYVATYNQAVNLIADSSEWGKPTREIRPPPLLRPTGRPRILRRIEADEQSPPSQSFQPSRSTSQHFSAPRQDPNTIRKHGGYKATQTSRGLAHWSSASGQGELSNRVTNKAAPVRPPWRI
ncbi:hypothetical protein GIB67_009148 [Kingdonia uniflora]|uniref:SWIM-type domain-containing protein n=1 Tax=Kingdonia uniflora TaxID=39325 RepID=A0A7J7N238_9MAGN|nr:hypothetical protein GIB67_009148 [Kingdonia uniflora]